VQAVKRFEQEAMALMADVANKSTPPVSPPNTGADPRPIATDNQQPVHRIEQNRLSKQAALKTLSDTMALIERLECSTVDVQIIIHEE
jgi:hypothetical protein